ncbi:MFS transporter [soil metagenome]
MTSIEQSYPGRLYPRLAILAVGLFAVATNGFMIAGILPSIASTLGVHASDVSYSITWYSITVAVAAPLISILFPRMSRTTLMAGGRVLVALGTLLAAAAPTLLLFTLGRVLAGLGGAAIVPAATAAAAALAPEERRGRAIAFVAVGFTASTAFGAPLGTALAAAGGWRLPLLGLAVLAVIVAVAVAVFVRGIPVAEPISVARRFGVLANHRRALALAATLLGVAGFNVVYIFSSAVTQHATGGDGALLAALLLVFGVSGIAGNLVSGRLIDRFGSRRTAALAFGVQVAVMLALPFVSASFAGTAILFALWGVSANASLLPVQHRLIGIDPPTSGVALSWYSTALYAGISIAPLLGAAALHLGGGGLVPLVGALAAALGLLAFQLSWAGRRTRPALA